MIILLLLMIYCVMISSILAGVKRHLDRKDLKKGSESDAAEFWAIIHHNYPIGTIPQPERRSER